MKTTNSSSNLVSIIIPCYNAAPWIGEAIESCLKQTYQPIEIIVIDDGSTDESLSVIRSFGEQITYETEPNRGGSHARNRGFALSRGEYVLFLDADDLIAPDTIKALVTAIKDETNVIAVCDMRRLVKQGDEWKILETSGLKELPGGDDLRRVVVFSSYPVNSILHSRKVIEKVGGWDESLTILEDVDLLLRVLLSGVQVKFAERGVAYYRLHPPGVSTVSTRFSKTSLDSTIRVAEKLERGLLNTGKLGDYAIELGRMYYGIAQQCFALNYERGWECERRAKRLAGSKAITGTPIHRFLCMVIGLRNKVKLAEFLAKYGIATRTRRQGMRRTHVKAVE